jgi:hypothetical protein
VKRILTSITLADSKKDEHAAALSGITGGCTWRITGMYDNYTLAISGNGVMEDHTHNNLAPWHEKCCRGLKTLVIHNGVTAIGNYAFYGCEKLTGLLKIPNSVTVIGYWAFAICHGLIAVNIPNSTTVIGSWAFYGCTELAGIMIPASVISIGDLSFAYCRSLTAVTNFNPKPQSINSSVFEYVDTGNIVLSVPAGSHEAYRNANVWKDFGSIRAIS